MSTLTYKTVSVNKRNANKKWLLVDAEGHSLGRVASEVAKLVRGKHKPEFTPHDDCGDFVIVVNADKIKLTGGKWSDKKYIRYTGYPGGQRIASAQEVYAKRPEQLFENAVKGMLPKTKLGNAIFKNVHIYAGAEHDKEAQKPLKVEIK